MLKRLARFILRNEIFEIEKYWWQAGVNQQKYEPESAAHGYKTYFEYWGEEE